MTQENLLNKGADVPFIYPTEGIITDVLPGSYFGLKDADGLFASVMIGMDCRVFFIRIPVSGDHAILGFTKVIIDKKENTDAETGETYDEFSISSPADSPSKFSIIAKSFGTLESI